MKYNIQLAVYGYMVDIPDKIDEIMYTENILKILINEI